MSELRGKVLSSLRWQTAAKLGSQVISWSITLLVMRLLAPADYGLMAMAMVLVPIQRVERCSFAARIACGAEFGARIPVGPRHAVGKFAADAVVERQVLKMVLLA